MFFQPTKPRQTMTTSEKTFEMKYLLYDYGGEHALFESLADIETMLRETDVIPEYYASMEDFVDAKGGIKWGTGSGPWSENYEGCIVEIDSVEDALWWAEQVDRQTAAELTEAFS